MSVWNTFTYILHERVYASIFRESIRLKSGHLQNPVATFIVISLFDVLFFHVWQIHSLFSLKGFLLINWIDKITHILINFHFPVFLKSFLSLSFHSSIAFICSLCKYLFNEIFTISATLFPQLLFTKWTCTPGKLGFLSLTTNRD